jgi:hypothetical protein
MVGRGLHAAEIEVMEPRTESLHLLSDFIFIHVSRAGATLIP